MPIARAWLVLVFPACILGYMGQGALILDDPAASNPFFLLVPGPAQMPLVILATLATVIASQAVITGAFSVALRRPQLGYLPGCASRTPRGDDRPDLRPADATGCC